MPREGLSGTAAMEKNRSCGYPAGSMFDDMETEEEKNAAR